MKTKRAHNGRNNILIINKNCQVHNLNKEYIKSIDEKQLLTTSMCKNLKYKEKKRANAFSKIYAQKKIFLSKF